MNSEQASRPETNGHDMQPNSDKKQSMDSSSELLKHESLDHGQKKILFWGIEQLYKIKAIT